MSELVNIKSDLINKGEFVRDLDEAIRKLSNLLTDFYEKYANTDATKGEITSKIQIVKSKQQENEFEITTSIKLTPPQKPKQHSRVQQIGFELMVDSTGSAMTDPLQASLDVFDENVKQE